MSTLIRCNECKGFKQISPLGGIVKTCQRCKGVGYVDDVTANKELTDKQDIVRHDESPAITDLKKRISRKRKPAVLYTI